MGDPGHALERGDVFGAAVGVARVIEGVHADENILGSKDLGPREREGKEDRVAGGDVGNGDIRMWGRSMLRPYDDMPVFRDRDIAGERRAAELAEVDIEDDVLCGTKALRDAARGVELCLMSLPIPKRERVAREALGLGDGQNRGGVKAAAQEDDSSWMGHARILARLLQRVALNRRGP